MNVSRWLFLLTLCCTISSCSLSNITDITPETQGELIDHKVIESYEGARYVYIGTIVNFMEYLAREAMAVARFTDELSLLPQYNIDSYDGRSSGDLGVQFGYLESRAPYEKAQATRVQAEQAIQLLNKYGNESSNNMKAHLYAMLGFVHIMLADNYCSGIPLSRSSWGGEFSPTSGLPTDSLYQRAVTLFDVGLNLNPDSSAVKAMLLVGKARALTHLGLYHLAAQTAELVSPSDSAYLTYMGSRSLDGVIKPSLVAHITPERYTIKNNKGLNGLEWISDHPSQQDMRVRAITDATGNFMVPLRPYSFSNNVNLVIAGWAEAELIKAEYYLSINDVEKWLSSINNVRRMYTSYSGATLPDITDPATYESRVDLLFKERAFTTFMSARRLGDLRRLIRQYDRLPQEVFPVGQSEGASAVPYASVYVFAVEEPAHGPEAQNNPNYTQCESYEP